MFMLLDIFHSWKRTSKYYFLFFLCLSMNFLHKLWCGRLKSMLFRNYGGVRILFFRNGIRICLWSLWRFYLACFRMVIIGGPQVGEIAAQPVEVDQRGKRQEEQRVVRTVLVSELYLRPFVVRNEWMNEERNE